MKKEEGYYTLFHQLVRACYTLISTHPAILFVVVCVEGPQKGKALLDVSVHTRGPTDPHVVALRFSPAL